MILVLQLAVILYTLSGVAAKFASEFEFLSLGFVLCYGAEIAVLGIYAIVWQQIIKRIELSVAYTNRGIALLWSMVWSALIFHEQVTWKNILGVVIIILGIWVVNSDE